MTLSLSLCLGLPLPPSQSFLIQECQFSGRRRPPMCICLCVRAREREPKEKKGIIEGRRGKISFEGKGKSKDSSMKDSLCVFRHLKNRNLFHLFKGNELSLFLLLSHFISFSPSSSLAVQTHEGRNFFLFLREREGKKNLQRIPTQFIQ